VEPAARGERGDGVAIEEGVEAQWMIGMSADGCSVTSVTLVVTLVVQECRRSFPEGKLRRAVGWSSAERRCDTPVVRRDVSRLSRLSMLTM
jgi:hypothetical protein